MKLTLRPYQKNSVNGIHDLFKKVMRVVLVSPTGSGKTVIASKIMELVVAKGNKVLFLAHRRELINQCSKKLIEIGVDHGVIMGSHPRYKPKMLVQIASVQTLINRNKPDADLIIIDECHRSLSNSYQEIINSYPDVPVLGLTATPWRGDGRGLGEFYNDIYIVSQVKDLVEQGYLMEPTMYIPLDPELEGLRLVGGDYIERELGPVMKPHVGHMVDYWRNTTPNKKTVVFACTVEHSKQIVTDFRSVGVAAEHLDCHTPNFERDAILSRLKLGTTSVVSNVGVLTEGWDCPELECVMLARPTKSLSLYLQMIGRGMRPFEGKDETIVIDYAGCTIEHGLATDHRDFNLQGIKSRTITPKLCPNCDKVSTADGRLCDNCNCLIKTGPSNYNINMTTKEVEALSISRCVKCNGTNIVKHTFNRNLRFSDPYKCKDCSEITLLYKFDVHYASQPERNNEFASLIAIQNTEKYDASWAKFKYIDMFEEWPN